MPQHREYDNLLKYLADLDQLSGALPDINSVEDIFHWLAQHNISLSQ